MTRFTPTNEEVEEALRQDPDRPLIIQVILCERCDRVAQHLTDEHLGYCDNHKP